MSGSAGHPNISQRPRAIIVSHRKEIGNNGASSIRKQDPALEAFIRLTVGLRLFCFVRIRVSPVSIMLPEQTTTGFSLGGEVPFKGGLEGQFGGLCA